MGHTMTDIEKRYSVPWSTYCVIFHVDQSNVEFALYTQLTFLVYSVIRKLFTNGYKTLIRLLPIDK